MAGLLPAVGLFLVTVASAARFGVPEPTGESSGWFVLTGPQIPTGIGNLSWGDQRHRLDLHLEVDDSDLLVEIYDPGLVNAEGDGLDAFYGGDIGQAAYRLFDPGGAMLAELVIGSDDAASNRALVTLYDGPTVPGVHRLEAVMLDTPTADEDINVFGVSVPGHDMYSFHFTGGEVSLSGATIEAPLAVWPWLVHSTPALVGGQPATGVDVSTWDLDSPARPPDVRLDTPGGRGADLLPSQDSGLFTTNLHGIDVGPQDCTDYGLFRFSVDALDAAGEGGQDANVFTAQLYDYDSGVQPADHPIAPDDPRRPIRLYYPRDDGSPPLKESLVHSAAVTAGPDPPNPGVPSTVEVSLEIRNPTPHELTALDLVSRLSADPRLSDPVILSSSPTLAGGFLGRELRVTGSVPPGETASVVYETVFTPDAVGRIWLTGDETDLQGGSLPTESLHDTPFEAGVRLGPICMLRIDAVEPVCMAQAVISGELAICEGETLELSAAGSSLVDCPGAIEYRWLRDGAELFPYPGPESIMDMPLVDTDYELEVRCDAAPSCLDASAVTVRVEADVPPAPVDDSLRVNKEFAGHRFTWTPVARPLDHLRHHDLPSFDRGSADLVAAEPDGEYFLPATPPVPYRVDFYRVFSANCAGTEEP